MKFLIAGTESGLGDLSMMISTVSEILEEERKELEASIRKEVVEEILELDVQLEDDYNRVPTYKIKEYALLKGITL